jgi:uncharacterized membrane protein YhaH (DUF805 family)
MNFIEAIKSGFANYVNFRTRAARSEYWFWVLFVFILAIITAIIDAMIAPGSEVGPTGVILSLALLLPNLAVGVRRLHDIDKSGWWLLLLLIPLVGLIILIVWFCQRGTTGPNRFGADPLAGQP